ncbi:MAG TPA: SGNH/GDSL hydrolase family protein [Bdellovibrionales bacterium]|nr:SGNH/GDSL hydrolase family protein [Bdellovibrionales bacterium]
MTLKPVLQNSLVALVSLACAVAAGELAVRAFFKVQFGDQTEVTKAIFDPQIKSKIYVPDPELGFVPSHGWENGFGRYGFKNGAEFEGRKARKTLAVLGDSLVDHGWLAQALQKSLNTRGDHVYYAGMGGYNTLQEAIYYERFVTLRPDILVLSFCLNDFSPSFFIVSNDENGETYFQQNRFDPIATANPFLFRHSALYRLFKVATIRRSRLYTPEMIAENTAMVRDGLTRLKTRASAQNTKLVAVIYPHFLDYGQNLWMSAAHARALELFRELEITYLDVTEPLTAEGLLKYRKDPEDFVHPNYEGHALAASLLLERFPEIFD